MSKIADGVDKQSDGNYVVAAGSLHASGCLYEPELTSPDHLAELPPWLNEQTSPESELNKKPARFILPEVIPEGERDQTLYKYACSLRAKGQDYDAILEELMKVNQEKCTKPLDDNQVKAKAKSACKKKAGHHWNSEDDSSLPVLIVNTQQVRELSDITLSLLAKNPRIFCNDRQAVAVRDYGASKIIEPLTSQTLPWYLNRVADWYRRSTISLTPAAPPQSVITDILATPGFPFPTLRGISKSPIFSRHGELITSPGYNSKTKYWLDIDPEYQFNVPLLPTQADILRAVRLLEVELLGDFPFVNHSSRVHVVAAIIQQFCRDCIEGPTPLFAIGAPTVGTGKTLLVQAIVGCFTDEPPNIMTQGEDDAEWRKRLHATLTLLPSHVVLDNLSDRLSSYALAATLTTTRMQDRILGKSEMKATDIRCLWLATGNNLTYSSEMVRRVIPIHLDANSEKPWQRSTYRHPDLLQWIRKNRVQLAGAALTIISNWVQCGQPPGKITLGSYESWAKVLGGILNAANIQGFLEDQREFYSRQDREAQMLGDLVAEWARRYGDNIVKSNQLIGLLDEEEFRVFTSGRGKATAFGSWLSGQSNKIVKGYKIIDCGTGGQGRKQYRLEVQKCTEQTL